MKIIHKVQGERRFFRLCCKWLAIYHTEAMRKNLEQVPFFGRWDDLYTFVGTPLETEAFVFMYKQLALDVKCKTPSLLAKWLKSENTSSAESRKLATLTRKHFNMTSRQYRKVLSALRGRINVLERLMSAKEWDKIEFDKIPSKAGLKYKNAFARNDILKERYRKFAVSKDTKVNAGTLYPADVVHKAFECFDPWYWRNGCKYPIDAPERMMVQKYWDNLNDYFKGATFNGVAVVDTSGSMLGTPMEVAISMGMYCADKCGEDSPWHNHYISFSRNARLVEMNGADFVEKVYNIAKTNVCENTNLESVFDLLLNTAQMNNLPQSAMPENVIIFSDMELDRMTTSGGWHKSDMDNMAKKWEAYGYTLPKLVWWNVNARHNTIPMEDRDGVTYVSGYSPVIMEQVLKGKTSKDLMLDKLNSERYSKVSA